MPTASRLLCPRRPRHPRPSTNHPRPRPQQQRTPCSLDLPIQVYCCLLLRRGQPRPPSQGKGQTRSGVSTSGASTSGALTSGVSTSAASTSGATSTISTSGFSAFRHIEVWRLNLRRLDFGCLDLRRIVLVVLVHDEHNVFLAVDCCLLSSPMLFLSSMSFSAYYSSSSSLSLPTTSKEGWLLCEFFCTSSSSAHSSPS